MIKICLLSENYSRKRYMKGEHGLSLWIQKDDKNILFDTGQSDLFSQNAQQLGIDLSEADMLVLSHGHYDHTGGVPEFCSVNQKAPIYINQNAFHKRYNGKNDLGNNIGIPWVEQKDGKGVPSERLIRNKDKVDLSEGIFLSGQIPRNVSFEEAPKNFYMDDGKGNLLIDIIMDEQMLVIKGSKGMHIFSGCSHAGIVNCVEHVKSLFPKDKIISLTAGMHLETVSETRLQKTMQYLLELDIEAIIPLHCTGMMTICKMMQFFKGCCKRMTVGDQMILEE
ncbi:MBL fold metallo-hydrolase [Acetivibrio cellulolyticus]|uniref:MBL fold metallo-hydrolase n=1 Tax=Acetivibrio cellulolyticus TaxID=35830 RepID=UPI0001E2CCA3|nr:MBL fold metallo-hydrolase [Acetivibrio cellulolyticus]